jgi:hypothetical protein
VELGQKDTLQLAKQVNDYQRKLQDTTRKMMAVVSELSMNQVINHFVIDDFNE